MAEGETKATITAREKVPHTTTEWETIEAVVNHGAVIPPNSTREVLMGYQYALHQQKKPLLPEKREIQRRRESVSATSKILRDEHNNASYTNGGRHHGPGSQIDNLEHGNRGNHVRNLELSFLLVNERGNIVPKTPVAALVAA
jgi:hypothetical protein